MTDCFLLRRVQCGVSSCRRQCRLAQPESAPAATHQQSHQSKKPMEKHNGAGKAGKQNPKKQQQQTKNNMWGGVISLVIVFVPLHMEPLGL